MSHTPGVPPGALASSVRSAAAPTNCAEHVHLGVAFDVAGLRSEMRAPAAKAEMQRLAGDAGRHEQPLSADRVRERQIELADLIAVQPPCAGVLRQIIVAALRRRSGLDVSVFA